MRNTNKQWFQVVVWAGLLGGPFMALPFSEDRGLTVVGIALIRLGIFLSRSHRHESRRAVPDSPRDFYDGLAPTYLVQVRN